MKHRANFAAILLAIAAGAGPAPAETPLFVDATPQDNFKVYWLVKAEAPLVIDGRLDEAVWQRAKSLADWGITNYGRQKGKLGQIDFRAAWDDTYLYLGARMYHPRKPEDMDELRRQMGNVTTPIYSRECLEIHIDGNLDHATRFQSIVNGYGERMMIWFYDFGWGILENVDYGLDADWDVAGRVEQDHWTVELRFALADIQVKPQVGYMFGINPCWFDWADTREESPNYWWQYLTWSTHGDSHHDPRLYGRFILVNEEPQDLEAGLRLAYPDLANRRVMIQTDRGLLAIEKGKQTLQPYDRQLRAEAADARTTWERLNDMLAGGGVSQTAYLAKAFLPEQDEALKAVEAELASGAELARGTIAQHRQAVAEIARKLDDACWRVEQDLMLTALAP